MKSRYVTSVFNNLRISIFMTCQVFIRKSLSNAFVSQECHLELTKIFVYLEAQRFLVD